MSRYKKAWIENLKLYNDKNGTNYTFQDIQDKFIDAGEIQGITTNCMCNHDIKKNFEIKNIENGDTMIVGSECIKKYIPKATTTCKECNIKFVFNGKKRCKKCRRKISKKCISCRKVYTMRRYRAKKFIKCKICIEEEGKNNKCNKCNKCNKNIDKKYKYCYNCYILILNHNIRNKIRNI